MKDKKKYSEKKNAFSHGVRHRVKPIPCFLCHQLMVALMASDELCGLIEMKPEGKTKKIFMLLALALLWLN